VVFEIILVALLRRPYAGFLELEYNLIRPYDEDGVKNQSESDPYKCEKMRGLESLFWGGPKSLFFDVDLNSAESWSFGSVTAELSKVL
jgi:hypothetical protein